MKRLDFCIIGAPRCGTTALCKYLRDHPRVGFSRPKEPHFFSRLPTDLSFDAACTEYMARHFAHVDDCQDLLLGEGSVSYLYSPRAIDAMERWTSATRYIAMVRHPVDLVYSLHARQLYTLDEDEADFATAWQLQEERAEGRHVPRTCRDARLLQYRRIGCVGAALSAVFDRVPRERVHVIVFDDFVRDTRAVYRSVLDFLGLADDGRTTFGVVRPSKSYRWRWLHRLLRASGPALARLSFGSEGSGSSTPFHPTRVVKQLRKRIRRWNTTAAPRPPLPAEMRRLLEVEFAADVRLLSELLERDLTPWLDGSRVRPSVRNALDESPERRRAHRLSEN